jgi:AraC-like DNA-binding protein
MSYDQTGLLNTVAALIRRNPRMRLSTIAEETGVSIRQIQNVVSRQTGKCFGEFQRGVLLEEVRVLISSHLTLSIKEISFAMGYKSPSAFARAIRRLCGMSPEQLRSRVVNDETVN